MIITVISKIFLISSLVTLQDSGSSMFHITCLQFLSGSIQISPQTEITQYSKKKEKETPDYMQIKERETGFEMIDWRCQSERTLQSVETALFLRCNFLLIKDSCTAPEISRREANSTKTSNQTRERPFI